ncbi:MAG: hypothetical protein R2939_05950 [Kofleriaceae bacterium]
MPAVPWTPWSQANALEQFANAHEKLSLDLKQTYELRKPGQKYEIAKDLAAFANVLGGTLLLGAKEGKDAAGRPTGRTAEFHTLANAAELIRAAADAAALCRPAIVVAPEEIRLTAIEAKSITGRDEGDVLLLALNVSASLTPPVGILVEDTADAYKFPFRTLERTRYLEPDELVLHMNSHERRMMLVLAKIPANQAVRFWDRTPISGLSPVRTGTIEHLDPDNLIVKLVPTPPSQHPFAHVPLAFITAVWRDEQSRWNITINGAVARADRDVAFLPEGGR